MPYVNNIARAGMICALVAGPAAINPAHASLILKLEDGVAAHTMIVADGDASDADHSINGAVTYIGPIGSWLMSVTTGVSKPLLGDKTTPILDLNTVNISSGSGGNLKLSLTDSDFIGPVGAVALQVNVGGTTVGKVNFQSYIDLANTPFGTGMQTADIAWDDLYKTGGAFSGSSNADIRIPNVPYSVTLVANISHTKRGITSFDYEVRVPEPGTLALLGAGLLGVGIAGRRRLAR